MAGDEEGRDGGENVRGDGEHESLRSRGEEGVRCISKAYMEFIGRGYLGTYLHCICCK